MTDYKPGTVAVATVRDGLSPTIPNVLVFRTDDTVRPWITSTCDHVRDNEVTDVRPLVALDLDTEFAIRALSVAATSLDKWCGYGSEAAAIRGLLEQIREQTRPPKPAEPLAMTAVIEDENGEWWMRRAPAMDGLLNPWISGDRMRSYDHIAAVRVLSGGVSA